MVIKKITSIFYTGGEVSFLQNEEEPQFSYLNLLTGESQQFHVSRDLDKQLPVLEGIGSS